MDEEQPKLRVAAYCRVSTDSDEQATSYEAQIEHYTGPFTELFGIFTVVVRHAYLRFVLVHLIAYDCTNPGDIHLAQ